MADNFGNPSEEGYTSSMSDYFNDGTQGMNLMGATDYFNDGVAGVNLDGVTDYFNDGLQGYQPDYSFQDYSPVDTWQPPQPEYGYDFQSYHNSVFNDWEYDYEDKYNTQLNAYDELQYTAWQDSFQQQNNIDISSKDYDWRGYYLDLNGEMPQDLNSVPDKFAKPNHITFSDNSIYHGVDNHYGGSWDKNVFTPGTSHFYSSQDVNNYFEGNNDYTAADNYIYQDPFSTTNKFGDSFGSNTILGEDSDDLTLSDFNAMEVARATGKKGMLDHISEFVNPNEENALMRIVATVWGGSKGARIGSVVGGAILAPFGLGLWGMKIGSVLGGSIAAIGASEATKQLSGDKRRERNVFDAQTKYNAGDYNSQEEANELLRTIDEWKFNNEVERYRTADQSIPATIIDALLDTVVYGAEFMAGGKIVSAPYRIAANQAGALFGRSGTMALGRGQMGVAKSLNPKASNAWVKLANELGEAQSKGVKFNPVDDEIAKIIFNGPIRITQKQSSKIWNQVKGLDDVARAKILPQLLEAQLYRNSAVWIRSGDKIVSEARDLLTTQGLKALGAKGLTTLAVRQPSVQADAETEYIQSAEFKDGKFVYDERLNPKDNQLNMQLRAANQIAIEMVGGTALGLIGRSKAWKNSVKPIIDKVLTNPASKLGGVTGINKAVKAVKNSAFGKQLTPGGRFQQYLLNNFSTQRMGFELAEEYMEIVSEAAFDFNKIEREKQGVSYLDNLGQAIAFPVTNPKDSLVIASVVGLIPMGGAALGVITGAKTKEERRKFNSLMRGIYRAQDQTLTNEQVASIVEDVYGSGKEIYDNVTGKQSIFSKIFNLDPLGSDVSKQIFGKQAKNFQKAVNERADILAKQKGGAREDYVNQAIEEQVFRSIIFKQAAKNKDGADWFETATRKDANGNSILQQMYDSNEEGTEVEVFLEVLEFENQGKKYKIAQQKFQATEKGVAKLKQEAETAAAADAETVIVTKTGQVIDPDTKKFLPKAEISKRGQQAQATRVNNIISNRGELIDRVAEQTVDSKRLEEVRKESVTISKVKFRQLQTARANKDKKKEDEIVSEIKSELFNKLNITTTVTAPSEKKGEGSAARLFLTGRPTKPDSREIDAKMDDFIERTLLAYSRNPNLKINAMKDSIVLGSAMDSTGRTGRGNVEAATIGDNIFISGLAFARDPSRVIDEEEREQNVKAKYKINKTKISSLANEGVDSVINSLKESFKTASDNEKNIIRKALTELEKTPSSFERFIGLSQALSGNGRKQLQDALPFVSEAAKGKMNTAVVAEYTDDLLPAVSSYMSDAEQNLAKQNYQSWVDNGGKQLLEEYAQTSIPEEFLTEERRTFLQENQVKFYDKKTKTTKSYFLNADGEWTNRLGRIIKNKTLINNLEKRLVDKQKPLSETRSKKNLRKVEARLNFYRENITTLYDTEQAIKNRLDNSRLNLSKDAVAASELVLEQIDIIKKETGMLSAMLNLTQVDLNLAVEVKTKFKEFYENAPISDVSFSIDRFEGSSNSDRSLAQVLEDADPDDAFDREHLNDMGKNPIALFIKRKFGIRNGNNIIHGIRNTAILERISKDEKALNDFRDSTSETDSLHERRLKEAVSAVFVDPATGKQKIIGVKEVYEFYRSSKSFHLVPFIRVNKGNIEKTTKPRLYISNENNLQELAERNTVVTLEADINDVASSYKEAETADEYFYLVDSVMGIDALFIQEVNAQINNKILNKLTEEVPEGVSIGQHLKNIFYKDNDSILNLIEPYNLADINLKSNFQNKDGSEAAAIMGDSHLSLLMEKYLETMKDELSLNNYRLGFAFFDTQDKASPEILLDQQIDLFNTSQEKFGKHYYQVLPRFAEKKKTALIIQRYYGNKKSDLLKQAKITQQWIRKNISTPEGRDMHIDPVNAIKRMKGNILSGEDLVAAHQLINMPQLLDVMVGDISNYVISKSKDKDLARYENLINLIARHSQVSTDGIRHEGPVNIIKVKEPLLEEHGNAEGLDGQFIIFENLGEKIVEDMGEGLIRGQSDAEMIYDSDGNPVLDGIKAHISGKINQDRILVKVNMLNPTIMQESTRENDRVKGSKSELDNVIKYVREYNLGKNYEDQIHGVAFGSGAKFFPAEETNIEEKVVSTIKRFSPSILRTKENKNKVFLFGDNLQRKGKAGQAIIRDEPNAFGIPTKKAPSTSDDAYFTDNEYDQNIKAIDEAINKIPKNKEIVIPEDGLGTGLAQLKTRAPKTFEYLNKQIAKLNQISNPNIIKLGDNADLIRSTNLRHGTSANATNTQFKQQHAQLGVLNQTAVITTPEGTEIRYMGNGVKAAQLRLEVSIEQADIAKKKFKDKMLIGESTPSNIKTAMDQESPESFFDPRYEDYFIEQMLSRIVSNGIPNVNRTALQMLGGLSGSPETYGPTLEGGYFKTSRVRANVNNARYNTYTEFTDINDVINYIKENRKYFYDMFFVDSNGYPTNEVMIHELEKTKSGKYIIPGEYVINTRIPSGSLASHSFGRLTEPASPTFKNFNIAVTNEGIRIAKGEDMDGDKSYTHLMARRVDTSVPNGMYAIENNTIKLVNEFGEYNLVHEYSGWSENNPTKKETKESKLNRAMALEFAIWHTPSSRTGYDLQGDIPKSAFDELIINQKMMKSMGVNISTPRGFLAINRAFEVMAADLGIFAKSNSTYSWLTTAIDDVVDISQLSEDIAVKGFLTIDPSYQKKDTKNNISIPETINFNNAYSVKRALELMLNRAIDDNKEAKLLLMNMTPQNAGYTAFLLMTNVTHNDFPANNSDFALKDENGNFVYKAAEDVFNVLNYVSNILTPMAKDIEAELVKARSEGRKPDFKMLSEKHGGDSVAFYFKLKKASNAFRELGVIYDIAFEAPLTYEAMDSVIYKMTYYRKLASGYRPMENERQPLFVEMDAIWNSPIMEMAKLNAREIYRFQQTLLSTKVLNILSTGMEIAEDEYAPVFASVARVPIQNNITLQALKNILGLNEMSLEDFKKLVETETYDLIKNKKGTDKSKKIITEFLTIENGLVQLAPIYKKYELNNQIFEAMEGSFQSLTKRNKVLLTSYMVMKYGLNTSNFTGTILGIINADFSKKINGQINKVIESIELNPAPFIQNLINDLEIVIEKSPKDRYRYFNKKSINIKEIEFTKKGMSNVLKYLNRSEQQPTSNATEIVPSETPVTEVTEDILPEVKTKKVIEVSTAGDRLGKRFSALNAKLKDGRTIEEAYQLDVKGYRQLDYTWQQAKKDKGQNAPIQLTPEQLQNEYDDLWREWISQNPSLFNRLVEEVKAGAVLNDKFAGAGVSQAATLTRLVQERIDLAESTQLEQFKYDPEISADDLAQVIIQGLKEGKTYDQFLFHRGSGDQRIVEEGLTAGGVTGFQPIDDYGYGDMVYVFNRSDLPPDSDGGDVSLNNVVLPPVAVFHISALGDEVVEKSYYDYGNRAQEGGDGPEPYFPYDKKFAKKMQATANLFNNIIDINKEMGEDPSYSIALSNSNTENAYKQSLEFSFAWEPMLLKKANMYHTGKWDLPKTLREAQVPKVFQDGFLRFTENQITIEEKIKQIKNIFNNNLSLTIHDKISDQETDQEITNNNVLEALMGNPELDLLRSDVEKRSGSRLPFSHMNTPTVIDINQAYRIITLDLKGVQSSLKTEPKNVIHHKSIDYNDMILWGRANISSSEFEFLEIQSDLFQGNWDTFMQDVNEKGIFPDNELLFVLKALKDKNHWYKIATESLIELSEKANLEISFPTSDKVKLIESFAANDVSLQTENIIHKHYNRIISHAEKYTGKKVYKKDVSYFLDKKNLLDITWDTELRDYENNLNIDIEGVSVNDRNEVISDYDSQFYQRDYVANDPDLVAISQELGLDLNPSIDFGSIYLNATEKLKIESLRSLNVSSNRRLKNNIKKINKSINDLVVKYPGLLSNGNNRFLFYYDIKLRNKDDIFRLIADQQYTEAVDLISDTSISNNRRFANDILSHNAIIKSVENNKNDKPNDVLLQTLRSQYGIQDSILMLKAEDRIRETYENIKEELIARDDVKSKNALDNLPSLSSILSMIKEDIYQQHSILNFLETKYVNKNQDYRLFGSVKKAIRLINGNPTKFEINNGVFEDPYNTNIDEVSYSVSFLDSVENVELVFNPNQFNNRFGIDEMQSNLVDATRKSKVLINNGLTLINNLLRMTGGKDFYTKDEKGNFKIIKTNSKIRALGRKMRKTLTYLVENYNSENDKWMEIQLIDPEVAKDNNIYQNSPDDYRPNAYYIEDNKGNKIYFKTLGQLVEEIEQERKEIAPHLLSFSSSNLESTIGQVKNILENQFNEINKLSSDSMSEEFFIHRKNYIPHNDLDLVSRGGVPEGRRETARSELARKFDSYYNLFVTTGILPRVTLDVAEIGKQYVRETSRIVRNRVGISTMALVKDVDLMPMILFDSVEQLGVISEKTANALADTLIFGVKSIDKNIELKDNVTESGYKRLSNLVSQINPRKYGYVEVKTGMRNVKTAWVKEGQATSLAKHIFNDKVRFSNKYIQKAFDFIEQMNLLGKISSVSMSLFHPFALYESYVAIMGVKATVSPIGLLLRPYKSYKQLREQYSKLATDPKALSEWNAYGLQTDVGRAPDMHYARYHGFLTKFGNKMKSNRDPFSKLLGNSINYTADFKHKTDILLWEVMLPMMKIQGANLLYNETIQHLETTNQVYNKSEIKSDIAAFINDAFGSQEWEQYVGGNPAMRQILNQIMFAPDWTLSALNVSGLSHIGGINKVLGSPTSDTHQRLRANKYWVNFAGLVLLAMPNALQAAIYLAAQAAGAGDDEDEMWTVNNEKGQKLSVDITPFLRMIGKYDELGKTKKRRVYLRWGKQAYEVFEGWLGDPVETVLGKSSIGIKIIMEQSLDMVKPGWETAWADHTFLESLFAVDGKFWDGRIGMVAQKFLPMSISPLLRELEDPTLRRPPAFFAPARLGTSEYNARLQVAEIARLYAEANLRSKFKNIFRYNELESLTYDILDGAIKNGYNPEEIFRNGVSAARTYYYKNFYLALERNDFDSMKDNADKLQALGTPVKNLEKSIKTRYKDQYGVFGIPPDKYQAMYKGWYEGQGKYDLQQKSIYDLYFLDN